MAFTLFGDDVKQWITINEPKQVCQEAYGSGIKAPFIKSHGLAEYLCTHNVIKAHAKAWHLYDDEFRNKQKGKHKKKVFRYIHVQNQDQIIVLHQILSDQL